MHKSKASTKPRTEQPKRKMCPHTSTNKDPHYTAMVVKVEGGGGVVVVVVDVDDDDGGVGGSD